MLVNGSGGPIEGWHKVLKPLSEFATVVAYNRPGMGRSAKPQMPQTGVHMATSLHALLEHADLPPPYVLVGHSLGGLIVNLFARSYPAEVAGVVLLEATSPDDVGTLDAYEGRLQRILRRLLARVMPPDPLAETEHLATTVSELKS
ncbi:alpha/beta fold hydrolase, partial [Lysobacter sp. D1-1-M9]|uniref:alpha/beta fold hydrolase n=1 Tax=Novilysobacter longmucuonensis TaxID=3098603 RepID=UPI002FC9713B